MSIYPQKFPENFKEDIFVNFCKDFDHSDFHYHINHYEICYVLEGKAEYVNNSKVIELNKYDMVFTEKGMPHGIECKKGVKTDIVTINFSDEYLSKLDNEILFKEIFNHTFLKTPSMLFYELTRLITRLCAESDYPFIFSKNLVEGYIQELLVLIYRTIKSLDSPRNLPVNGIIEAASKYICANYDKSITLADIAEYCHINKYHLSRLFKNIMGVNLFSYLNTIRVHEASAMLLETDKTILEISNACGFNSLKHFCDVFKKETGVSASAFRKKNSK